MEKQFVTTTETPQVLIEANGSLRVKGSDELLVVAKSDSSNDLKLEGAGEVVSISCNTSCSVRVPTEAVVKIRRVGGEAVVKALEGELTIEEVNGSLAVRNVGLTRIERVRGDLAAKHVSEDLFIKEIYGSLTVRDVQGDFVVEDSVKGNLNLDDVGGDARAKVFGNATLRLDPAPGGKYDFEASGNLFCRLPEDASVKVHGVTARGSIRVDFEECERQPGAGGTCEMTLGEGDADLTLKTENGNIYITPTAPDWEMSEDFDADLGAEFEGMAEQISDQVVHQVETQMEMLERQMEAQMSHLTATIGGAGLSAEQAERIAQRAREASSRAAERAQERMQRAQERLQQKMEAVKRRAEQRARSAQRRAEARERRSWGFEWPAAKPEPPVEPVSDDERLMILRMLEEKKISLEQAEQLLSALEGK